MFIFNKKSLHDDEHYPFISMSFWRTTGHFIGTNVALRRRILVGRQKHNVLAVWQTINEDT